MKKTYITPELEAIKISTVGMLALSGSLQNVNAEEDTGNPGYYIDL